MDKTVIEKLNDPLVHIIRNSIDHGIELPGEREQKGKQRKGTVHLSAMHSGGQVLIIIQDDGAGIDSEDVRRKALETGLLTPDAELSEKEIFSLIFAPGFTTAAKLTNVSGRGVGMDVVKRAVDNLGGTVEIESRKGTGTTIVLKLPLTLAIIEGLLVKIGSEYFVLPLSAVEECVELTAEDVIKSHGRHIANVRGQIVPYIRLREKFVVEGNAPEREQIVIIASEGQRVGFVVDSVVGEHQTVIKSLGTLFRNIDGVSGATILGDGTVALIIDIAKLVRMFEREEVSMAARLCSGSSFCRDDRQ
jgi:two-component system chemotaxis sensor kinase CheA